MILTKSDWDEFPTAIPDYSTRNTSFLELSRVYHLMGIENSNFHLSLLNPDLVGIDPHAENLTLPQKEAIVLECEYNPWYFLREVVRIPPQSGITGIPFRANRANISLAWTFLNHIDYYLIQPRQTGKSVSTDCIMTWLYTIKCRNTSILLITKDNKLRADNIERLKKTRALIPEYIVIPDKDDANNSIGLTYNRFSNKYSTAVGQTSEGNALKVGRGSTVPVIHFDEVPFIPYIDIVFPAAMSASNAVRKEAALNGMPYGNLITTTAGSLDTRSGRYAYEQLVSAAPFDEGMYDCANHAALVDMVDRTAPGRKLMIAGVWSHTQLGISDKEHYENMVQTGSTGAAADRDYFNRWTTGNSESFIDKHLTRLIMESEIQPLKIRVSENNFALKYFVSPEELRRIFKESHIAIGIDTSDAINRDAFAMTFVNQEDLGTVATVNIRESNLMLLAFWVAELVVEFTNSTVIIEKKSSAQTFIDVLTMELHRRGIDPFKRMFNRIVDNKTTKTKEFQDITRTMLGSRRQKWYDGYKSLFGFNTTGDSRDLLYSKVLINALKVAAPVIRDPLLSGEIRQLAIRNGRLDHGEKGHDDQCMSWLLANWLFMYGQNLSHYGIDSSKTCLRANAQGDVDTPEQIRRAKDQSEIRAEIEEIETQLKDTRDVHLMMLLQSRLTVLEHSLDANAGTPKSLDAVYSQPIQKRPMNRTHDYEMERSRKSDAILSRIGQAIHGGHYARHNPRETYYR